MGRPAVSTDLDSGDNSETEPLSSSHTPADLRHLTHRHKGLHSLASVREDAPNPHVIGGPWLWVGGVGWGCWFGDILLETVEVVWDGEQLGGGLDRDED